VRENIVVPMDTQSMASNSVHGENPAYGDKNIS